MISPIVCYAELWCAVLCVWHEASDSDLVFVLWKRRENYLFLFMCVIDGACSPCQFRNHRLHWLTPAKIDFCGKRIDDVDGSISWSDDGWPAPANAIKIHFLCFAQMRPLLSKFKEFGNSECLCVMFARFIFSAVFFALLLLFGFMLLLLISMEGAQDLHAVYLFVHNFYYFLFDHNSIGASRIFIFDKARASQVFYGWLRLCFFSFLSSSSFSLTCFVCSRASMCVCCAWAVCLMRKHLRFECFFFIWFFSTFLWNELVRGSRVHSTHLIDKLKERWDESGNRYGHDLNSNDHYSLGNAHLHTESLHSPHALGFYYCLNNIFPSNGRTRTSNDDVVRAFGIRTGVSSCVIIQIKNFLRN